jgi:hypothetical protein
MLFSMELMITRLVLLGIGAGLLLTGDDAPIAQVQVTHTQRLDFPSGGVLHLKKSTGDLTVQAWERPDIEITTIQSTKSYHTRDRAAAEKKLDRIRLVTERHGDELTVTTEFPKHEILLRPILGVSEFEMQSSIKVPRNARLVIEHDSGNIYIDNVTGDIEAKNGMGQIVLHLPENGQYAFDAKCDFGAVESDFPGPERGTLLGRSFVTAAPPAGAQKLHVRMGVGDITILKIRQPALPAPLKP